MGSLRESPLCGVKEVLGVVVGVLVRRLVKGMGLWKGLHGACPVVGPVYKAWSVHEFGVNGRPTK